MEFSVREWTIIVGVLLIVAVFLDGYRRVRNERSNRIRVSLSKQVFHQQPVVSDVPDMANSELPNGGARVIGKRRDDLHLQQSVPVLIEPVVIEPVARATPPPPQIDSAAAAAMPAKPEPIAPLEAEMKTPNSEPGAERTEPQFSARTLFDDEGDDEDGVVPPPEKPLRKFFARKDSIVMAEPEPESVEPQEVLVVNVLCKDPQGFQGPDLLQLLLACDLRFGKKNIFHRYEKANAKGAIQFSVANLVEPGSFDLDAIDNFTTPGVTFFLSLPGPEQPVTAFNYLVETAQVLVRHLHAELRDDAHSVMTAQTIEHCRQRIRDFERKQLTLQL